MHAEIKLFQKPGTICKKSYFWNWASVILDKKSDHILKNGLVFFTRNDASSNPRIRILKFLLDFSFRNDASSIHRNGIFVHNSRIWVNSFFRNSKILTFPEQSLNSVNSHGLSGETYWHQSQCYLIAYKYEMATSKQHNTAAILLYCSMYF